MLANNLINFIDLEQGSNQWKEFRKWKIGSSLAASIRGVGFKTPLQLFEDIMEGAETPVNEAMTRGTLMEPIAREWLNNKYGSSLKPVVVQHPNLEFDWHISSIDALWQRPDGSIFVAEIKCPGQADHKTALAGRVPDKYIPQCFHILEDLPGVDKILYFSYTENSQAEVWVYRDEHEMNIQFAEELSFFNRLLSCTPPEPSDKDWVHFNGNEIRRKAQNYCLIQEEIKDLQAASECLKEELIQETGGIPRSKIGDLKIQKVIRQGAINYSKIDALEGIDLNQYRKPPIITWRAY